VAKIPGIRGVTYQQHGAGFRLKWRENQETPTGVERVQCYHQVDTEAEVAGVAAQIRKALDEQGYWTEPEVFVRPMARDLEALSAEWLNAVGGLRAHKKNTRSALKFGLKRFWKALRKGAKAGKGSLPLRLLNEKNVVKAIIELRTAGHAPGTIYQTVHPVICDFWPWAHRQGHPDLGTPPARPQDLLPPNASYSAPPDIPSWEEIDEMISRIDNHRALVAAVLMRATGLRLDQVAHIQGSEFDLSDPSAPTLLVVKGKSRQEQGLMRRVPVPTWLVPMLHDLGAWRKGFLIWNQDRRRNRIPGRMESPRNLTRYFKRAWQAAVADDAVREDIWVPKNRYRASTTHSIRAAYQSELEARRVQEYLLDYLVGHQSRTTRGAHYANPSKQILREVVDLVPPISPEPAWPPRDDDAEPKVAAK